MSIFFNNFRIKVALIILLTLSVFFLSGCQKKEEISSEDLAYQRKYESFPSKLKVDKNNIISNIDELSSDKYEGRRTGTQGEAEAGLFLASYLKNFEIPSYKKESYFQVFKDPLLDIEGENVIGILKNPDINKYIILSANYDHLGKEIGVKSNKIYPGANQNASGVSALMEIARLLSENFNTMDYNIVFAFWSGNEQNLLGSKAYTQSLNEIEKENIGLVINLDTIGTFGAREYIICQENNLPIGLVEEILNWKDFSIEIASKDSGLCDHYYFAKENIPAITIRSKDWQSGTGSFNDTRYGVNIQNVEKLTQNLVNFIYNLKEEDNV